MLLIVGLGNPGPKYEFTRHNIGFLVIDHVLKNLSGADKTWEEKHDLKAFLYKTGDILLAKPQAFMNASGFTIQKLTSLYKVSPENIWVIHDDIDLPLGKIRIRRGGSSAGHHGIESIMRELGGKDQFIRFRLGVGRGKLEEKRHTDQNLQRYKVEKYVVSRFTTHEEGDVRKLVKHAAKAVETALHKGLDKAMNLYN